MNTIQELTTFALIANRVSCVLPLEIMDKIMRDRALLDIPKAPVNKCTRTHTGIISECDDCSDHQYFKAKADKRFNALFISKLSDIVSMNEPEDSSSDDDM